MPNKIHTSEDSGSCSDLLKAIGLVGLADTIGLPGAYTCFQRLDLFDCQIGIVPGNFSAAEVIELFKAAALVPESHLQHNRSETKTAA